MRKLSKQAIADRGTITEKLTETFNALEDALIAFNKLRETAWEPVEEARVAYNDALANAKEWADELVGEMEQYIEERSEKWEESEAGQAYIAWKQAYEYLELDPVELEMPEDVELEAGNPAETIDALDEAP